MNNAYRPPRLRRRACALVLLVVPAVAGLCGGLADRQSRSSDFPRLTKDEVTLTYWAPNALAALGLQSYGEIAFYQVMERETGVRLSFVHPAPGRSADSAFRAAIASGDLPDIIEWDWLRRYDPEGPDKAIRDGIIVALDGLVSAHAPNLRAVLAERPDVRALVRSRGGALYAFPSLCLDPAQRFMSGPVVRTEWLRRAGLQLPRTVGDWEAMLRAFARPEQLGLDVPESEAKPLALLSDAHLRGQSTAPESTFEFFRMSNIFAGAYGTSYLFLKKEGRQLFGPAQPAYREMLAALRSWYAEGLLYLDVDSSIPLSRIVRYAGAYFKPYEAAADEGQLTPVPFPTLDGATAGFVGPELLPPYLGTNAAAISTSNAHKELSARWLDEGYGKRGALAYNFGVEGQSYEMANGAPRLLDAMVANYRQVRTGARRYADTAIVRYSRGLANGPFIRDASFSAQLGASVAPAAWMANGGFQDYALFYAYMSGRTDLVDELDRTLTPIVEYIERMFLAFVSGAEPLGGFGEYVAELDKMGIDRAAEILNELLSGRERPKP